MIFLLKILAVLFITFCSFSYGFLKYINLQNEVKDLETALEFFRLLKEEIRYERRPADELLRLLERGKFSVLKENPWVLDFTRNFGKSDSIGEEERCEFFIEKTLEKIKTAKIEFMKKGKVYISLGLFSGLAVSILII